MGGPRPDAELFYGVMFNDIGWPDDDVQEALEGYIFDSIYDTDEVLVSNSGTEYYTFNTFLYVRRSFIDTMYGEYKGISIDNMNEWKTFDKSLEATAVVAQKVIETELDISISHTKPGWFMVGSYR